MVGFPAVLKVMPLCSIGADPQGLGCDLKIFVNNRAKTFRLGRYRIIAPSNTPEKSFGLLPRLIRRENAVTTKGDKSLFALVPILQDIGDGVELASSSKALHAGIPNNLSLAEGF